MLWITKYRHNKITEQYQKQIDDLREALNRRDDIVEILDRLTDKEKSPYLSVDACGDWATSSNVMNALDDSVPRYVEDYFGGKVIKQESTPVTILDEQGKATYSQTAQKPDENKTYKLVQK